MKKTCLIICVFLISSCAQKTWYKPGITVAKFERDKLECYHKATAIADRRLIAATTANPDPDFSVGASLGNSILTNRLFESCLISKGYTVQK